MYVLTYIYMLYVCGWMDYFTCYLSPSLRQGCGEAGGECKPGEAWSRTCTWRSRQRPLPKPFNRECLRVISILDVLIFIFILVPPPVVNEASIHQWPMLHHSRRMEEAICGRNHPGPAHSQLPLRGPMPLGAAWGREDPNAGPHPKRLDRYFSTKSQGWWGIW